MQTFLPFPDFAASARCLDYRRLGKQRVETKQIYFALTRPNYKWRHHPAVKMWAGYESALLEYGMSVCIEWRKRGYKDAQLDFFAAELGKIKSSTFPFWFGNHDFHLSHQSNLIRKKPEFYSPIFPGVPDNLEYIWPTKQPL